MSQLDTPLPPLPIADLREAVSLTAADAWARLRGKRLFVTGGTGFVGKWLLATLREADRAYALGCEVSVLSRRPAAFRAQMPEMANDPAIRLLEGDVRDFAAPAGRFDIVIHAATDVATDSAPLDLFDTCVAGTRRVMTLAASAGATDVLLVSSGAVYGRQPPSLERLPEDHAGAPDSLSAATAYGQGKRMSEWIASVAAAERGLRLHVARLFAFVGPHLALDRQFAVGNFLADALAGRPVIVGGDGTDVRSYLYAAEMAGWCWNILLQGRQGAAYNVGSDESVAIGALAELVASAAGSEAGTIVRGERRLGAMPARYVPDIERAARELGLRPRIGLQEALCRTVAWYRTASPA